MQIIILGMHRSGTSCVSRLVNMMGAYFAPEGKEISPRPDNPKGHWERKDVVCLNNDILRAAGGTWDQVFNIDFNAISSEDKEIFSQRLNSIVLGMDAHRPWVLKDPRMCLTLPLWRPFLEIPVFLFVYRNPVQIAQSLLKRNKIPLFTGVALWEFYTVNALNAAKGLPLIFIQYENIMDNPVHEAKEIYNSLIKMEIYGLRMPGKKEITTFISSELYHHKDRPDMFHDYLNPKQLELIQLLLAENSDINGLPFLQISKSSLEILKNNFSQAEKNALIKNLEKEKTDIETTISNKDKELNGKNAELAEVSSKLQGKEVELERIFNKLKNTEIELNKKVQEFNAAQNLLERMISSASWQVTRPLRWMRRKLSRGRSSLQVGCLPAKPEEIFFIIPSHDNLKKNAYSTIPTFHIKEPKEAISLLYTILSTTSWKITAPLRWMRRKLRIRHSRLNAYSLPSKPKDVSILIQDFDSVESWREVQKLLHVVLSSSSWKITRPLRWIRRNFNIRGSRLSLRRLPACPEEILFDNSIGKKIISKGNIAEHLLKDELAPTVSNITETFIEFKVKDAEKHIFIVNHTIDFNVATTLYRAIYLGHSLSLAGVSATVVNPNCEQKLVGKLINQSSAVVLQRLYRDRPNGASFKNLRDFIVTQAHKNSIPVIGDIDDLFYPKFIDQIGPVRSGLWSNEQAKSLVENTDSFTRQMDAMLVSSQTLADYIKNEYNIPAVVRNNVIPEFFCSVGEKNNNDKLSLIFASGSKTHEKDFAIIIEPLVKVLTAFKHVGLTILGKIELPHALAELPNVSSIDYVSHHEMFSVLANHDLCLVPLEESEFNHAKSHLKFVQAGIVGTAVAATPCQEFKSAINDQIDGFLTDNEHWEDLLFNLCHNPSLVKQVARRAQTKVLTSHTTYAIDTQVLALLGVGKLKDRPTKAVNQNSVGSKVFLPSLCQNKNGVRNDCRLLYNNNYIDKWPLLDISVVTYNSSRWIDNFFNSLLNQEYPLKQLSIYVTDHSSSDDTVRLIKRFFDLHGSKFASVNIAVRKNKGYGAGHNNNAKSANAPWFLVTNVDLEFCRDSLTQIVNFAVNDLENTASWELRQKPYEHPKYYDPVTLETAWSSGTCILFRKSAWEEINGYDEKFFMYCEDVDISFRLRDAGYMIRYIPKATIWHYSYEEGAQTFKPLQFLGSFFGHCSIRLRFGSKKDIVSIPKIIFQAIAKNQNKLVEHKNSVSHFKRKFWLNALYFLKTRKKSELSFPFFPPGTMHEVHRDGAFYHLSDISTEQPLISIIMRTYGNRDSFLKEAVASVANQTHQNVEVIVCEDGSNYAEIFCNSLRETGFKIKHIDCPKAGRMHSGNMGLAAAQGEYMMFLDDDDLLFADHIEVLLDAITKSKTYAAAANSWLIFTIIDSNNGELNYHEVNYQRFKPDLINIDRELLKKINLMPIQAVLFSRKLYDQYGGLDDLLLGLEDWELWLRYSQAGDFAYVPKTTSLFRVNQGKGHNIDKQRRQKRAYEVIRKRYQSTKDFVLA